jgi:hypothetical protein
MEVVIMGIVIVNLKGKHTAQVFGEMCTKY